MPNIRDEVKAFERKRVEHYLRKSKGVIAEAARKMGVPLRTAWNLIYKHKIDADSIRDEAAAS